MAPTIRPRSVAVGPLNVFDAEWAFSAFALGEEPVWDARSTLSIDERLALVFELTLQQWRLSGAPIPDFEWKNAPRGLRRLTDDASGYRGFRGSFVEYKGACVPPGREPPAT